MATFVGTENSDVLPSLLLGPVQGLGNDSISGLGGVDIIAGYTGDDTLNGGSGGDVLIGGVLNIALNVGTISLSGNDTASYETSSAGVTVNLSNTVPALDLNLLGIHLALTDAVLGSGGDAEGDVLVGISNLIGSNSSDVLSGDNLANSLIGNDGADTLSGNGGNDILVGGLGDDSLSGGAGIDTLNGGDGDDVLQGGAGADVIIGGDGNNTLSYEGSSAAVTVDLDANTASGGDATGDTFSDINSVTGSNFADLLIGNAGDNVVSGLAGDDRLYGGAGDDTIYGGAGVDRIYGDAGDDHIFGGDGADLMTGGVGADSFDGGAGDDMVGYTASRAAVTVNLATGIGLGGDAQGDTYTSVEDVYGSRFADLITGNSLANGLRGGEGNDTIFGGGGNDNLEGSAGADQLNGGTGTDFAYYYRAAEGVIANLATGMGTGGEAAGDTYVGIEGLIGSQFNDVLIGNAGSNYIRGGEGDDTIDGGSGNDKLYGGAGADHFVFGPDMKGDVIADFDSTDTIDLTQFHFASIQDALAGATEGSNFVRLDFGDGDAMLLSNYTGGIASITDQILI